MTAPVTYKTLKVSAETHKAVHDLAHRLGGSADDALQLLIGESTVRIALSEIQRQRWVEAAAAVGVGVGEFVKNRVEAALQYGSDPGTMQTMWAEVNKIGKTVHRISTAIDSR